MRRLLRTFTCDQSGAVAASALFLMMISAGMVAFAVDMGNAHYTSLKLQKVADAAALGAVLSVHTGSTSATAKAVQIAAANVPVGYGTVTKAEDVRVGQWDKSTKNFKATSTDPNAIEVKAQRTAANGNPLSVFFSRLLGRDLLDVGATAIATVYGSPACILVLDPTGSGAFTASGSSRLKGNCPLHVNSTATGAAQVGGDARVNVGSTCVRGTATGSGWTPAPTQGTAQCLPLADPLASMPEPTQPGTCTTPPSQTSTLAPGCYTGSFKLFGNINLAPGLYYLKGAKLRVQSTTNTTGTGVRFYVDATSMLDLSGTADVSLSADNSRPERAGILIFGARNAMTTSVTLSGTGRLDLDGTLYTPSSLLAVTGNSTLIQDQKAGYIITKRLSLGGSSTIVANGFPSGINASSARLRASLVE